MQSRHTYPAPYVARDLKFPRRAGAGAGAGAGVVKLVGEADDGRSRASSFSVPGSPWPNRTTSKRTVRSGSASAAATPARHLFSHSSSFAAANIYADPPFFDKDADPIQQC